MQLLVIFLKKICIFFIFCYQKCISPFFPLRCRFVPTCSEYTKQAINKYGIKKGVYLGFKRILKCHQFSKCKDIYDPIK